MVATYNQSPKFYTPQLMTGCQENNGSSCVERVCALSLSLSACPPSAICLSVYLLFAHDFCAVHYLNTPRSIVDIYQNKPRHPSSRSFGIMPSRSSTVTCGAIVHEFAREPSRQTAAAHIHLRKCGSEGSLVGMTVVQNSLCQTLPSWQGKFAAVNTLPARRNLEQDCNLYRCPRLFPQKQRQQRAWTRFNQDSLRPYLRLAMLRLRSCMVAADLRTRREKRHDTGAETPDGEGVGGALPKGMTAAITADNQKIITKNRSVTILNLIPASKPPC